LANHSIYVHIDIVLNESQDGGEGIDLIFQNGWALQNLFSGRRINHHSSSDKALEALSKFFHQELKEKHPKEKKKSTQHQYPNRKKKGS
jgi:hypothetical protein